MIIGISGYIGSGKDTVGKMIQWLTALDTIKHEGVKKIVFKQGWDGNDYSVYGWEIKKFAGKMKQIASILTGIPVEKFEDQEFKNTYLGTEWDREIPNMHNDDSEILKYQIRTFLQELGTEAIRNNIHENAWVNALFADYVPISYIHGKGATCLEDGIPVYPDWIITDCRFPNEAQAIKDRGGIVIRIHRKKFETFQSDVYGKVDWVPLPMDRHSSETALDDWKFDWEIDNNDTLDTLDILVWKVKEMLIHYSIIN